ncbi:MAG: putative DNA-binding domain-containing protein [Planctomycetes bacterium]|nr:putative DNA-binding domain-containing protein [Planctomycetota bacterium]
MPVKANKKPSLAQLQHWMRGIIERGGPGAAGTAVSANINRWIAPSRTLQPAQRLEIYSGMYLFRLQEVLTKDFPCVAYALGDHAWHHATRDYVAAHPSRDPNLNNFNADFADYLYKRKDLKHARFLGDLARLEWAMVDVVFARSGRKPNLEPLRTVAPERWEAVTFAPAPTLRILTFDYPANDYLQEFRDGKHPRIPRPKVTYLAVQRVHYTVWRITLSAAMYTMLGSLAAGDTLRAAIRKTLRARKISSKALETAVFRWFASWVGDDFFESISAPASKVKLSNAPLFGKDRGPAIQEERIIQKRIGSEAAIVSRGEAARVRK